MPPWRYSPVRTRWTYTKTRGDNEEMHSILWNQETHIFLFYILKTLKYKLSICLIRSWPTQQVSDLAGYAVRTKAFTTVNTNPARPKRLDKKNRHSSVPMAKKKAGKAKRLNLLLFKRVHFPKWGLSKYTPSYEDQSGLNCQWFFCLCLSGTENRGMCGGLNTNVSHRLL